MYIRRLSEETIMPTDYSKLKANGFMLQKQKDTFSMRLRVLGGNISVEQLDTISKVAKKYAQGYVHLTSIQGVEIPFVKLEDIDAIVEELHQGGVELGASGPRVRTVTACQGGRCCPSGCIDAYEIAEELDKRYFGKTLPHKFKFGVTGCPNNCLKAEENDLGVKGGMEVAWNEENCVRCGACVRICRRKAISLVDGKIVFDKDKCHRCGKCARLCPKKAISGKPGFVVSFAGTFGNDVVRGKNILPMIESKDALFRVTDVTLEYFEKNAQKGERFVKTLERLGWEDFTNKVRDAYEGK